jgi:hypothetical protein
LASGTAPVPEPIDLLTGFMMSRPDRDDRDGSTVFVFEFVVGVFALGFVGGVGYELHAFTDVAVDLLALPVIGGAVVGTLSVLSRESDVYRLLDEYPLVKTGTTVVGIGLIAGAVWLLARTAAVQAVYAAMSTIVVSLIARGYVFVYQLE